jgi:hypothetical protein
MKEKIPSNVIIKTNYAFTKNLMSPHFVPSIIDQTMQYIKEHPRNYENLEIEAKLGRFEFKGDYVRNFEKINEIFVIPDSIHTPNPQNKFNFVAGILPRNFFLMWSALEKESKLNGANIDCIKPIIFKDSVYTGNKRKSQIFQDGKLIKEEIIRKENKKHINVRNNGFDFRITCSEEMPTDIDEESDQIENVRDKYRVSYQLSYYRVDLTLSKDKDGEYYEVEIEMNLLKKELVGVKQIDEPKIRVILDRFIQNIFNLYSVLMPDSIMYNAKQEEQINYEIGVNKHLRPEEIQSKFGNYFQNNLFKK